MDLTTPALLFPAITLLLLAYTNRFLGLAGLIRRLHTGDRSHLEEITLRQIDNLSRRLILIRNMQALGVLSFLLCSLSMLGVFLNAVQLAKIIFGISLLTLVLSLLVSLYEILISTSAIKIELEDLQNK